MVVCTWIKNKNGCFWPNGLPIHFFIVELLLWYHYFGHTNTHITTLSLFLKYVLFQKSVDLTRNGFVYLNEKLTLSFFRQNKFFLPLFPFDVLLQEKHFARSHTYKSNFALFYNISSLKLLSPRQKWLCISDW